GSWPDGEGRVAVGGGGGRGAGAVRGLREGGVAPAPDPLRHGDGRGDLGGGLLLLGLLRLGRAETAEAAAGATGKRQRGDCRKRRELIGRPHRPLLNTDTQP